MIEYRKKELVARRRILKALGLGGFAIVSGLGVARNALTAPHVPPDVLIRGNEIIDTNGVRNLTQLSDLQNGFTVPANEVWQLDSDETIKIVTRGNIEVYGVLISTPKVGRTHTIRFIDIDNSLYEGGGHEVLASDVGIWVAEFGQLHFEGVYRRAWIGNEDDHSSWRSGDDLWQAPFGTDAADEPNLNPVVYKPGDHREISRPVAVDYDHGDYVREYENEVLNLTRNLILESKGSGQAHLIFLHCKRPQYLANMSINSFGPRKIMNVNNPGNDGVLGRYPVHFHHCRDGSRGSVVSGVVVRNSGNRAFVPHASHGIFFNDCIAWDTTFSPFWWDQGDDNDHSHNITFSHCAAVVVRWSDNRTYGLNSFALNGGIGNSIVDSLAVGSLGTTVNGGAFHWPSQMNRQNSRWFFENNVAHNNRGSGITVWQNKADPHTIANCALYNNGEFGISHGAYTNQRWRYFNNVVFENNIADVEVRAVGASEFIDNDLGHVLITHHKADTAIDTTVFSSKRGWKIDRVTINEQHPQSSAPNGGVFRFKSIYHLNDLQPQDFTYNLNQVFSTIYIENVNHPDFII